MAFDSCNYFFLAFFLSFAAISAFQDTSSSILHAESEKQLEMVLIFEKWIGKYKRVYRNEEEKAERFRIFKKNVEFIESFNSAGDRSFTVGENIFSDHLGYRKTSGFHSNTTFRYANISEVPCSIDWRDMGAVTEVKDQGRCDCCSAFSAVGAVEGLNQIKTVKAVSLSEQQLLACDSNNNGCRGGFMETAFDYIVQNSGIATETDYPYEEQEGTCNAEAPPAASITGYEKVPQNDELALMKAVANQPVSVAVDASHEAFLKYAGGIFHLDCGNDLNHAVTAIGYGTGEDGPKYWLLKNSWGSMWGENGFMRLIRDAGEEGGHCGIAMDASYPTA